MRPKDVLAISAIVMALALSTAIPGGAEAPILIGDLALLIPPSYAPRPTPARGSGREPGAQAVLVTVALTHFLGITSDRGTLAIEARPQPVTTDFFCRSIYRRRHSFALPPDAERDGPMRVVRERGAPGRVLVGDITAFGVPLVLWETTRDFVDMNGRNLGRELEARIALTGATQLRVAFFRSDVPVERWNDLFRELEAALRAWRAAAGDRSPWFHERNGGCG
jgi:hypothetical protein